MSIINPNSINGGFPVFGQDNATQGFRDNFTNIKNNFVAAKTELEDIQGKVLVKSALLGGVLDNDMDGGTLTNAQLKAYTQTFLNLGQQFSDVTINFEAGNFQYMETGNDITLTIENWPSDLTTAAAYATLRLWFQVSSTLGVPHTITFPPEVNINSSSIKGMNDSTKTVTFPDGGNYIFDLSTHNGGTNIFITEVSRNRVDIEVEHKIDLLNANVTAANVVITTLLGNAAAQAGNLIELFSNAASQADTLVTLTSNAASQASNLITLTGNAASQATDLVTLTGNAASQAQSLTTLINNAASQSTALDTINANVGTLYLGNVSTQANLGSFQTYANTNLVTASANIASANIASANIVTINSSNLNVSGLANIAPISEKFVANTNPALQANVNIDFAQTAIVYVTGATGNITANVQNFNMPSGTISCITVWMSQGATPYIANLIQINSSIRTINWQSSTLAPPGNANKQDVISFTILNNGGTYTVLGQLATFG
jgi:hypothetical protein